MPVYVHTARLHTLVLVLILIVDGCIANVPYAIAFIGQALSCSRCSQQFCVARSPKGGTIPCHRRRGWVGIVCSTYVVRDNQLFFVCDMLIVTEPILPLSSEALF